ncbi:MAG: isoleucine--tRNA ligase [Candidatus Saccharibacteria bacterium]
MPNSTKKHFLAEIEEQMLASWEKHQTFEKSLAQRKNAELFSFYDGPPFANGQPHYGHLVQTTIKDSITRYKTMQGYYVPRRIGWDTHGLPIEYAIEKEHDFKGKKDILEYGIAKFNQECRDSVFKYKDIWESMFKRVGRWADYSQTYATMDDNYIESVWWAFKTIYDKGLIYKDFRSSPYCPRCATPLSNFELNQGYQDNVSDPSLYVKFKIRNNSVGTGDASLLAWTTTPWSLPGNAAIAVKPDADYVYVQVKDDEGQEETLVLARNRLETLSVLDYHIVKELKGQELVGLEYEPLFDLNNLDQYDHASNLYKVWGAEFVSIDDGSGVLHVAPAFGEDDLQLGKEQNLPVLLTIDENGHVVSNAGLPEEFAGKFFKAADKTIIAELTKQNKVYAAENFLHTYPFCWRCDTPLLYYATDSWLVKVTDFKDELVNSNEEVNWTPGHIKEGRFGKWLENARDWAISRNRFWGAPLPVWITDDGEVVVIGSIEELKKRSVDPNKVKDLHRPYIDDVVIKTDSGKLAKRIPEVFDCWFESGSMPYAQDHYPFQKNQNQNFPTADFIAEAVDQTRGWFYTLHVLATALFDKPAYQNVITSGWVVAADGEKLSKRKKNYAPMDEIFDQYGVDSLRYFMASSPIVNGEDVRFSTDFLRDIQRKVFMTLNNIYSFYKLYADVDGFQPDKPLNEPKSDNILDQWILSRLNQTIEETTKSMDNYRLDKATRPLNDFLDDCSNWFVRRSRRRFWKSEDDGDKKQAYATLHYTLLRTCQLLAPFSPFLPDYIWQKLAIGTNAPDSVHLSDWPVAGTINAKILTEMSTARDIINQGLALRAEAAVKVRQPLEELIYPGTALTKELENIVAEEVNVKKVTNIAHHSDIFVDTTLTPALKREGLMRDVIRQVQNARKQADLQVDDRIKLSLFTEDKELQKSIEEHEKTIMAETLAISLSKKELNVVSTSKIAGHEIQISLQKS